MLYNFVMENRDKKKVLIVGAYACAYSLARKFAEQGAQVFVAPGSDAMKEFATVVDLRKDNELLDFVLENAIDLTVVAGDSGKSDIATLFQENNQPVFCPTRYSSGICQSKVIGKKFMHRYNIPCPKFGVFEKASFAISYLENSNYPVVIKTDHHQRKGVSVCNNIASAKTIVDNLFALGEKKVLIEDYIWGHEFSFYVITDGYHAIPLGCVATYKYELEGNGGMLSSGMGAFSDNYRVSNRIKERIMQEIITPALNALEKEQKPYSGILGADLVIDDNENLYTIEFNQFLKSPDAQVILELLDDNIYNLFEACAIGSFADDYDKIEMKDENAIACVLCSGEKPVTIEGLENLDENTKVSHFNTKKSEEGYKTGGGQTLVLTRRARVLSKAVRDLYDEISVINYDGKKYRRDIGTIL